MVVLTAEETSCALADYLRENGINPFTNSREQKDGCPNHYQLELKSRNKNITIYFCRHDEKKSHFPASYSRLEITVEEKNEKGEKIYKKFTEFGLDGIVATHTGVGNLVNAQLLYEELKEEIFVSIAYDLTLEIMAGQNI